MKIKYAYYYKYNGENKLEFADVKTLEQAIIKGYTLFPRPAQIWVSIEGTIHLVFEYKEEK